MVVLKTKLVCRAQPGDKDVRTSPTVLHPILGHAGATTGTSFPNQARELFCFYLKRSIERENNKSPSVQIALLVEQMRLINITLADDDSTGHDEVLEWRLRRIICAAFCRVGDVCPGDYYKRKCYRCNYLFSVCSNDQTE